jgi:hypothetical protein
MLPGTLRGSSHGFRLGNRVLERRLDLSVDG